MSLCVREGTLCLENQPLQLWKSLAGKPRQAGPGAPMIDSDQVPPWCSLPR